MTSCIVHIYGCEGVHDIVYFLLQTDRTDLKLADIKSAVLKELTDSCHCQSPGSSDEESFACFQDSPNSVTYRARLKGTSNENSASVIEEWVSSGPNVRVRGLLMWVDTQCSVVISDFSEEECSGPSSELHGVTTTVSTTDGQRVDNQNDNTVALVGGVVAVVIVLIVTVGVIVVVALVVRNHHGELPIKKAEE